METAPATGALLIRAWIEEDRVKARLILLADGQTETLAVVVGEKALLAVVQAWLHQLTVTPR